MPEAFEFRREFLFDLDGDVAGGQALQAGRQGLGHHSQSFRRFCVGLRPCGGRSSRGVSSLLRLLFQFRFRYRRLSEDFDPSRDQADFIGARSRKGIGDWVSPAAKAPMAWVILRSGFEMPRKAKIVDPATMTKVRAVSRIEMSCVFE